MAGSRNLHKTVSGVGFGEFVSEYSVCAQRFSSSSVSNRYWMDIPSVFMVFEARFILRVSLIFSKVK